MFVRCCSVLFVVASSLSGAIFLSVGVFCRSVFTVVAGGCMLVVLSNTVLFLETLVVVDRPPSLEKTLERRPTISWTFVSGGTTSRKERSIESCPALCYVGLTRSLPLSCLLAVLRLVHGSIRTESHVAVPHESREIDAGSQIGRTSYLCTSDGMNTTRFTTVRCWPFARKPPDGS